MAVVTCGVDNMWVAVYLHSCTDALDELLALFSGTPPSNRVKCIVCVLPQQRIPVASVIDQVCSQAKALQHRREHLLLARAYYGSIHSVSVQIVYKHQWHH